MSITFTTEVTSADICGYRFRCVCDGVGDVTYPTFEAADEAYRNLPGFDSGAPWVDHDDCDLDAEERVMYRPSISAVWSIESPEMNVSNMHAFELFGILGVNGDHSGTIGAEDLRGRILVAQALVGDDLGRPAMTIGGDGHASMTECGRPAGYFNVRLAELATIAECAASHGRGVQWC